MDRVRALRGCSFNVNVWGVGERGVVSRAPSRPRRAGRGREARDQPGPTRHELTADWESHDYLGPETVTVNMLPTSQQISKRGFVMDCIALIVLNQAKQFCVYCIAFEPKLYGTTATILINFEIFRSNATAPDCSN